MENLASGSHPNVCTPNEVMIVSQRLPPFPRAVFFPAFSLSSTLSLGFYFYWLYFGLLEGNEGARVSRENKQRSL